MKKEIKKEEWEKEFDKKLPEIHGRRLPLKVKSFIRQLLKERDDKCMLF